MEKKQEEEAHDSEVSEVADCFSLRFVIVAYSRPLLLIFYGDVGWTEGVCY